MSFKHDPPLIGIVGVCASGKTTLINELQRMGYSCRHIAQEHSYVQNMWQRLTNPDLLIYLTASYETTLTRRNINWTLHEYQVQLDRLQHAREQAHVHIDTNPRSASEVFQTAKDHIDRFLSAQN
ncbi:MAG: hypothetical protein CVU43_09235 [Chloroflexi bacterium HGW-Chloroflexi-5]|jgi:uridine kinase|nr:MAG: hypothetical protein CVU43_09235 [Chloroflexi bacterium HGW-Chloroflexi-5]